MSAPSQPSSLVAALRRLDAYRSVPQELTEQTTAGASVSLISAVLIAVLFLSEFVSYLSVSTRHQMFVEQPAHTLARRHMQSRSLSLWGRDARSVELAEAAMGLEEEEASRMRINFNISLPRISCALTSVALHDVLGEATDLRADVVKYRLDSEGRMKRDSSGSPLISEQHSSPDSQRDEGCMVVGRPLVKRVPGSVHFTSHASPDILQLFYRDGPGGPNSGGRGIGSNLNTSHVIHSLYFGDADAKKVGSVGRPLAFAPLNGATKVATAEEVREGSEKSFEYYIQIIPTVIERIGQAPLHTFQYVSNSNEIVGRFRVPAIFLRYDVEAISVRFQERRTSFSHFAVQCCAIIGGVVSVLGLLNMFIKAGVKTSKPAAPAGYNAVKLG